MKERLIPARFLFRFSVPCRYRDPLWSAKGAGLDESFRLATLAELEGREALAEVRAAWSESGLAFSIRVEGKKQEPWCRPNRPEDSDAVQVFIDTRDVHDVHRATRFCHRFVFMPAGEGKANDKPVAIPLAIHRAKESPNPIQQKDLRVYSEKRINGYLLDAFIPAEALTGFNPGEQSRLGFNYMVIDRELGVQTLAVGSPLPFQEDPSLWATLELVQE